MSILFINMTGRRLFTAFAVFEPDACSSFGNFLVKQWFWIEPDGISYSVYSGAVRGSTFWAYAHDGQGNISAGSQSVCLSDEAATFCVGSRMCLNPYFMAAFPTNNNQNQILTFNS